MYEVTDVRSVTTVLPRIHVHALHGRLYTYRDVHMHLYTKETIFQAVQVVSYISACTELPGDK